MPRKPALTDDDLLKLSHLLVQQADDYLDETITHSRAKAYRYYMGENPDGVPLVDGRSRIVDTQLRDTIEWIMPDLVRTFAGDDEIVAIEPHGDDDNFDAEMAEEWVNYVIMRQNRGFLTTHHWIKDALMSKLGFIKQYWFEHITRKRREFSGLDEMEYRLLEQAEDFDITDVNKIPLAHITVDNMQTDAWVPEDDMPLNAEFIEDADGNVEIRNVYDVSGYQVFSEWQIREEPLPPEEVGFSEDTKEIPWKSRLIYHETQKTIGELREMFPEVEIPDDIQGWNITETGLYDEETIERFYDSSQTIGLDDDEQSFIDPSLRKVWLYEIYMKADRDGDGIPEWLQLFRVGDELLSVDEVDYPKIFAICPILWPHRVNGLSLADLLFDLQELQTVLNRQILDHIYQANNPRTEISMPGANEDTLDDYLDNRIGGYVRVDQPGTIRPLEYSPLEPWTFNLLEHWEQKRESRTGVSRLNGGLDPNALNKTATGVVQILNQAARRIEQIARIFAETGFRDRVRGILDLSAEYPDYVKGQISRLSGETREINPESLSGRFDLVVNAGIGTGNKEQQAQHMMNLLSVHQQLMAAGLGPGAGENQMVTFKNIYNVIRDMITNWGHRNTADYITDPTDRKAERDPEQKKGPSPDELDHQVKMKELELKAEQARMDNQAQMAELALKREELKLKEREVAAKEWEIGARAGAEVVKSTRKPEPKTGTEG